MGCNIHVENVIENDAYDGLKIINPTYEIINGRPKENLKEINT